MVVIEYPACCNWLAKMQRVITRFSALDLPNTSSLVMDKVSVPDTSKAQHLIVLSRMRHSSFSLSFIHYILNSKVSHLADLRDTTKLELGTLDSQYNYQYKDSHLNPILFQPNKFDEKFFRLLNLNRFCPRHVLPYNTFLEHP